MWKFQRFRRINKTRRIFTIIPLPVFSIILRRLTAFRFDSFVHWAITSVIRAGKREFDQSAWNFHIAIVGINFDWPEKSRIFRPFFSFPFFFFVTFSPNASNIYRLAMLVN